jgi:hypothetical protein
MWQRGKENHAPRVNNVASSLTGNVTTPSESGNRMPQEPAARAIQVHWAQRRKPDRDRPALTRGWSSIAAAGNFHKAVADIGVDASCRRKEASTQARLCVLSWLKQSQ